MSALISAKYAPTSDGLLEPIQSFLNDGEISEIMLNRPREILIEKAGTIRKFDIPEYDERMLHNLFQLIARENKQEISDKKPLLSGSLLDGSRIQLIMPPVAKHYTFSIRRVVAKSFHLFDYEKQGYYKRIVESSVEKNHYDLLPDTEKNLVDLYRQKTWDQFIAKAVSYRKNIVISGGTSSGKTTFLNACLRSIDSTDRLIILEDTREIHIDHENQVNLLGTKDDQGLSKITMQDLVQASLRLRPDRIIMGEIRGQEILDFVSACSTGHEGSMTTIHANNPRIAFMRMTQMYKLNNVPSMRDEDIMRELKEVIDIVIQLNKTKHGRMASHIYYKHGDIEI